MILGRVREGRPPSPSPFPHLSAGVARAVGLARRIVPGAGGGPVHDGLREGERGGGRHQFERADLVVELGLDEGSELGHRDRGESEARERFGDVALVVAAELGDLRGDLGHDALHREIPARVHLEGRLVVQQASVPHVVGGIDGPGGLGEEGGDEVVVAGHRAHRVIEVRDREVGAHGRHAGRPHHPHDMQAPGRHPDLGDRAEVVRESREAASPPVGGEPVEEAARAAVVDLPEVAEGRCDGGEEDEVVQIAVGGRAVQVERAPGLRREYPRQRIGGGVEEGAVLQRSGEMEDALKWALEACDRAADVRLARDVAGHDVDLVVPGHLGERGVLAYPLDIAAPGGIPVDQGQVPCADGQEVGDEAKPEAAETPGDQVGRLGVEEGPRVGDVEPAVGGVGRGPEDQLALVLSGRHQPEGPGVFAVWEDRHPGWRHGTLPHEVDARLGEGVGKHRIVEHEAVHIDRGEAEVLPEDPHAERTVGVDVDLPDLAVPAGGTESLEAERDMMAGERIQDDVDPLPLRVLHQLVVPGVTVRVVGAPHTHLEEPLPLALVSRGRVDLRADVPGECDRGLPDAAHRRMDEDPLALPQAGEMDERVVGGDVDGERGRRLFHAQARGLHEGEVFVHDDAVGDAAARGERHLVADPEALHPGAGTPDHAARLDPDLAPERRAFVGERREES